MSNANLTHRLVEDVVIFENNEQSDTGAQSLAPDHSPRATYQVRRPPLAATLAASAALRAQVEQFLFYQSELLDGKHWQNYVELFADDGVYWMPVTPDQTDWLDSPSIFAEDRSLMEVRVGRLTHPNAWSQAPHWETSHIVSNVVIESASADEVQVRSRFQIVDLRRDNVRHLAGTYRHTLACEGSAFRIRLQRVDLVNSQAPFDYVLQAWV